MRKIKTLNQKIRGVHWANWAAGGAVVFILPLVYQCLVEYIRLQGNGWLHYVWDRRGVMLVGWVALVAFSAALTFACARPWVTNLITGGILLVGGCANYLKLLTRGDPVVPKDVVQINEAALIAGDIKFPITGQMWVFFSVWVLVTLLLLPFKLPIAKGLPSLVSRIVLPVMCLVFIPFYVVGYVGNKDMMAEKYDVYIKPMSLADSYSQSTFATGFLYLSANMWQAPPQNYSRSTMQALAAELPQANGRRPDIVIVLLESFFDLTKIEGTRYSEPLMPNYQRLAKEGVSGTMLSDKRSGGTSDFEYAALTGFASTLFPLGSVPMIEYADPGLPALPGYLKENGYRTVAIHPYTPSFYGRSRAYHNMGIDEFYSEADFSQADVLGNFVSDEVLANRVIAEYEKSAQKDESVFIHTVTMQNHMPYDAGIYPEDYRVKAESGQGEAYDEILSTFATGVRDEDRMIGILCDYFRTVDRDVVLLFFGDHQTDVADDELPDLYSLSPALQQMPQAERWKATHTTPYLMWANYRQEEVQCGFIAPYLLVPVLMREYNVDGPAWFGWLAQTQAAGGGCMGGYYIHPDGTLSETPTEAQQQILAKQALFQHDILFGKQYAKEAMYR